MSDEIKNIDYEQGLPSAIDLHDSVKRENPLPQGGEGNVGLTVMVIGAIILILGGRHLFSSSNGLSSSIYISDNYQPEPRPSLGGDEVAAEQVAWIEDWMSDGKKVYNN